MHLYTERSEAHSTSPGFSPRRGGRRNKTAPYFLRNRGQKERLPVDETEKCAREKKKNIFPFYTSRMHRGGATPLISILIEKGFSSSEAVVVLSSVDARGISKTRKGPSPPPSKHKGR